MPGANRGFVGTLGRRGNSPKTASSLSEDGEGLLTGLSLPSGGGDPAGVRGLVAFSAASSLRALGQEDNEPLTTLWLLLCRVTEPDKGSLCGLSSLLQLYAALGM